MGFKKALCQLFLLISTSALHSQDSVRFYKTIDTLCSNYFYGRGYENEGHSKTADFLIKQFQNSDGLEVQHFSFEINHFIGEMSLKFNKQSLVPCQDFIPIAQASGGEAKLRAVLLDSLFFLDSLQIKKFIDKDLKKKAIIYNDKFEAKITSSPLLKEKIYSGSGALIKCTNGATLKTFSTSAWMPPAFSVVDTVYKNQKNITFELHQKIDTINSRNISAIIKGKDTTLPELIICAHYDHVGGYEGCFIPGANDNATGLAMLLELYHFYLQHQPQRSIRFIAFGAEEVGLVGSKFYVRNIKKEDIFFVLNLDLLGAGSGGITVVNATILPEQFSELEKINKDLNLFQTIKKRGEAANSDHYYFTKKGIPSFFIYSNGKVGGYHNISDTPNALEKGNFSTLFKLLEVFSNKMCSLNY